MPGGGKVDATHAPGRGEGVGGLTGLIRDIITGVVVVGVRVKDNVRWWKN